MLNIFLIKIIPYCATFFAVYDYIFGIMSKQVTASKGDCQLLRASLITVTHDYLMKICNLPHASLITATHDHLMIICNLLHASLISATWSSWNINCSWQWRLRKMVQTNESQYSISGTPLSLPVCSQFSSGTGSGRQSSSSLAQDLKPPESLLLLEWLFQWLNPPSSSDSEFLNL